MIWLAAHMWFLLLVSFAVGLGVGWWIWGARTDKSPPTIQPTPMGTLDSDAGADKGDL